MVTPEEIAKAMAVHSATAEPRGSADSGTAEVLIDDEQVQPEEQ